MDTHHEEPIVVMADEVAEGVAENMLTLEPLSPVHNRDDGRAPTPVPGLYDEPRRDLMRHDGRGRGRGGGRGRGRGRRPIPTGITRSRASGRAGAVRWRDERAGEDFNLKIEQQLRGRQCATEAAAAARTAAAVAEHEAWKQRLEPIPNFGSLEPEPISLSPVEREWTEVQVRLHVDLPFQLQKNDFMDNLCPVDGLKKSKFGNKLKNLEYLHRKFISGEWASKPGVTYTHDSSGCIPTKEEIIALTIRGLNLKGKIVFEGGGVVESDKGNDIEKLWKDFLTGGTSLSGIPTLVQTEALLKKMAEHNDFHLQMCRIAADHRPGHYRKSLTEEYPAKMRVDEPGIFDRVKTMVGMDFHPPAGEYEQIPENSTWESFGSRNVVMCDNPDCCRMSHFALKIAEEVELQLRANGHKHRPDIPINALYARIGPVDFPRGSYEALATLLLHRLMYRRKDEINGNFDICYQCLHKKAHPVD